MSRNVQIAIRAYGSDTSGAVADPTLKAIDRFFDAFDNGVETADRLLNRAKQSEELSRGSKRAVREVIDVDAQPKPAAKTPATAIERKPRYYIVESISSAGTLFVVTDGGNARAECTTRELAEKILRAMEAA